jgi:nucleoside-diphosphate-sugar epimerase
LFRDGCLIHGFRPVLVTHRILKSIGIDWEAISPDQFFKTIQAEQLTPTLVINATGPGSAAITTSEANFWAARQYEIVKLLGSLRESARVIHISSGGTVYGDHGNIAISENATLLGGSPYANYQIHAEKIYQSALCNRVTVLRIANPFGIRQASKLAQGLVSQVISNVLAGNPTTVYGDGGKVRDYFFDEDLYEIIPALVEHKGGGVFNIGSGVGFTQAQVISTVEIALNLKANVIFAKDRPNDLRHNLLDCTLAKKQFNWTARSSLLEGIMIMSKKILGRV